MTRKDIKPINVQNASVGHANFLSGNLLRIPKLFPASLLSLMDGKDEVLQKPKDMPQAEVPIFVAFLEGMLAVEPNNRKSAAQMLKHPWLAI
jgi:serine/threonine-protein kinase SRPK3